MRRTLSYLSPIDWWRTRAQPTTRRLVSYDTATNGKLKVVSVSFPAQSNCITVIIGRSTQLSTGRASRFSFLTGAATDSDRSNQPTTFLRPLFGVYSGAFCFDLVHPKDVELRRDQS
jgi:hypothetical protein